MGSRLVTIVLGIGLFLASVAALPALWGLPGPGNQQGYEPVQPIAFSHRLHAGELQISCLYCHAGAERSPHAGIPAASVCLNCHRFVTAPLGTLRAEEELAKKEKRKPRRLVSPELQKLYDALALDEQMRPDPARTPTPIAWIKVHNLPAFACFDHQAHVHAGVSCQQCHGPVQNMERLRQVEDLSMGWCVNCHRQANQSGIAGKKVNASLDCATCHY
jgi:hypothetical protein